MLEGEGECGGTRARKMVLTALWDKEERSAAGSCKATGLYVESRFSVTTWSSFKAMPAAMAKQQVHVGRGLRLLALCRLRALPTGRSLAKPWEGSKQPPPLSEEYLDKCPCCGVVGGGETIDHILVECSRWAQERKR